jgi:ATP-dependent helicase/DNAse subunit B
LQKEKRQKEVVNRIVVKNKRKETIMEALPKEVLTKAVQDMAISGLSYLVEHNIKGAKLIQNGLAQAHDIVAHNELLKQILQLLQPILTFGSDALIAWLSCNYAYLVPVYIWAKDVLVSFMGL